MFSNGAMTGIGRMKSECLRFTWLSLLFFLMLIYVGQGECQQESTSLQIVSPLNGSIVAPGQDIIVIVQVAEGASFAAIQVIGENLGISQARTAPPFEFSVHIPRDLIGPKKIRAFGRTGPESGVFSPAVTINIESSATPTALSVSPPQVHFERIGQQARLTVTGSFDDGNVRDVTKSSQTTFTSNNPSVATVDTTGLATAVGPVPAGTTQITTEIVVSHRGLSVVVPVIFRPIPTPQGRLEGTCAQLQGIVNSNPGTPLADKAEDAFAKCQTAVNQLSKTPPDKQAAVGNVEGAVGDLQAAVDAGLLDVSEGAQLMDQLAVAARELAADAREEPAARGSDPQKIAEVRQTLAEGDALKLSGAFKDAVNKYKDALVKAESA